MSNTQFNTLLQKMLEKQKIARVNNQHFTSITILKDIITLCFKSQQWNKLYEYINYLMSRRGQSKKAQIQMIQLCMTWLVQMKQPQKTKLIECIRDVCAKKIFLEVEYARCVLMIVKNKQNDNDILQAAKILQQVQVETYGSMDKRQKLQFILYQMKIMLKKEDWTRFFIISKKINQKNINADQIADIKINYYAFMAIYYNQYSNYNQCSNCYKKIFQTLQKTNKIIPQNLDFNFSTNLNNIINNYIIFLILQPYNIQNQKHLEKLKQNQFLEKNYYLLKLINTFLSLEIVTCNLQQYNLNQFQLFRNTYHKHQEHSDQLCKMLVQHNIRIISKYYSELTLNRMSELIGKQKQFCQQQLCELNNSKLISCRIDRIDGLIDFKPVQNETYLINNWNQSINSILDMVDTVTNLIHRQRQVHHK